MANVAIVAFGLIALAAQAPRAKAPQDCPNVQTGQFVYHEDANYGSLMVPCHLKPRSRPPDCDGWLETRGTSNDAGIDVSFTLENRSTPASCRATAVIVVFQAGVQSDQIRIATPEGWKATQLTCASDGRVCGIEWRTHDQEVGPGQSLPGFGLSSSLQGLLKGWVIEVGGRRVSMPYGHVGGN